MTQAMDMSLSDREQREQVAAMEEIFSLANRYGVTLQDLVNHHGGFRLTKIIRSAAPKYKDPVSGKTWNGRGTSPSWLLGKNRDDFLIPVGDATAH